MPRVSSNWLHPWPSFATVWLLNSLLFANAAAHLLLTGATVAWWMAAGAMGTVSCSPQQPGASQMTSCLLTLVSLSLQSSGTHQVHQVSCPGRRVGPVWVQDLNRFCLHRELKYVIQRFAEDPRQEVSVPAPPQV